MRTFTTLFPLVGLATLLWGGCSRAASKPDASYEVRAEVRSIERSGAEKKLQLAHEAIANFRDRGGKVVGMPTMTMGFGLAPGVTLQGIQVRDKVHVRFAVRWQASEPLQITHIRKLAANTPLHLGDEGAADAHAGHDHAGHPHGN